MEENKTVAVDETAIDVEVEVDGTKNEEELTDEKLETTVTTLTNTIENAMAEVLNDKNISLEQTVDIFSQVISMVTGSFLKEITDQTDLEVDEADEFVSGVIDDISEGSKAFYDILNEELAEEAESEEVSPE